MQFRPGFHEVANVLGLVPSRSQTFLIISAKTGQRCCFRQVLYFCKENNLQEPEFSPAALCSIPFSNAVGEKYNFPQSPQWFLGM
jgi:hypothetical protein